MSCEHCKSKQHTLSLLLDAAIALDEKRKAFEQLLNAEDSEAFFPIMDTIFKVGAEMLNIELDSAKGDEYSFVFFDGAFGSVSREETLDKLLKL